MARTLDRLVRLRDAGDPSRQDYERLRDLLIERARTGISSDSERD